MERGSSSPEGKEGWKSISLGLVNALRLTEPRSSVTAGGSGSGVYRPMATGTHDCCHDNAPFQHHSTSSALSFGLMQQNVAGAPTSNPDSTPTKCAGASDK